MNKLVYSVIDLNGYGTNTEEGHQPTVFVSEAKVTPKQVVIPRGTARVAWGYRVTVPIKEVSFSRQDAIDAWHAMLDRRIERLEEELEQARAQRAAEVKDYDGPENL